MPTPPAPQQRPVLSKGGFHLRIEPLGQLGFGCGKEIVEKSQPEHRESPLAVPVCNTKFHAGQPRASALVDWLEELAIFGTPRSALDSELACQLSLAIENWYLVRLALSTRARYRRYW